MVYGKGIGLTQSQIVMGLITLALCAAQASIGEMEDCYNYYANTFPAAAAACNAIIMLDGGVGLFAWRRPSDVHWHLTLSLDYLTLVVGLVSCAVSTEATKASHVGLTRVQSLLRPQHQ